MIEREEQEELASREEAARVKAEEKPVDWSRLTLSEKKALIAKEELEDKARAAKIESDAKALIEVAMKAKGISVKTVAPLVDDSIAKDAQRGRMGVKIR